MQKIPEINLTTFCSCCGKDVPINSFRHTPATEKHIRGLTPGKKEPLGEDMDFHTLLCPECYRKCYGSHSDKNI